MLTCFDVALSADGGEHTQDRRYVFRQPLNVEVHGQMSRGCEKERSGRTAKGWPSRSLAETRTSLTQSYSTSLVAYNRTK